MQARATIFYTTRKSKAGQSKPAITLRVKKQERKVEALAVVIGEPHEMPVPLFDAEEFGNIALEAGGSRGSINWAKWFSNWARSAGMQKSIASGTHVPLAELPAREDSASMLRRWAVNSIGAVMMMQRLDCPVAVQSTFKIE